MSPVQLAALHFIAFRLDQGLAPTLKEMADRDGISKTSMYDRLLLLRRQGYLIWKRGCARSFELTRCGRELLARSTPDDKTTAAVREERQAWIAVLRARATQLRSQAATWAADGFEEWADECNRDADLIEDLLDTMCRMRPAIGPHGILDTTEPDLSWRTDAIHHVPGLATESGVKDDAARHALCLSREMEP